MDSATAYLQAHLGEVCFFNGFSFLFLGIVILMQPRDDDYAFERALPLLAWSALAHGTHELVNAFNFISGLPRAAVSANAGLLLLSFALLVEFGRRLWQSLDDGVSRSLAARLNPAAYALPALGIAGLMLAAIDPLNGLTIGSRYFLGFPGALLVGVGFMVLHRRLSAGKEGLMLCPVHFLPLAALGFVAYALFGGLIVPAEAALPDWLPTQASFQHRVGVPVEVFRALCALLLAVGVGALLRAVNMESRKRERMTQAVLSASEGRFRGVFESANVGIAFADADGRLLACNTAYEDLSGYSAGELQGMHFSHLTHPDDMARLTEASRELSCGERDHVRIEKRLLRKNGETAWVDTSLVTMRNQDGMRYVAVMSDITERKRAEGRLRLLARVFEHSGEAIMITDADNRVVTVNEAFTRLTGYAQDEVVGKNPRLLATGRTPAEEYGNMWHALTTEGFWEGEIWDRRKDGTEYPKWLAISVVRGESGNVLNYIGRFNDITAQKRAEEQIRRLAHHDPLTGLPNRFTLRGRLEQALATARRDKAKAAILFVDIDRFKTINDTLGHHIGDLLLIEVAARLQSCVRDSDVVARLGGDEFVAVLTGVESGMAAAGVGEKILRALGQPYAIEGHDLRSTPSIGIALFPDDGEDAEHLMKSADTAMYHAKSSGRNNCRFFTPAMNAVAGERLRLEQEMHLALERQEFVLHYQPQIDVESTHIRCIEVLVRWNHPQLGLMAPDKFLPVAEESGFIIPLGEWILDQACRQLREWRDGGLHAARIAVNISATQLRDYSLVDNVLDTLARHGLEGADLELEMSEAVAMHNPEALAHALNTLRDLGVALVIDDFGTGYSSLRYLKLLPVQRLKLDRSFIKDIEIDRNDAAICAATMAMAQNLGLGLAAQGVECEAERDTLNRFGYSQFQGYLYCEPMSAEDAQDFMRAQCG